MILKLIGNTKRNMNRKQILFKGILAVIGLSLVSCQSKEIEFEDLPDQDDAPVFHASMEEVGSPESKVYVDENLMVLWHADDRISIFNKYTYNQQYQFQGETGANAGVFKKVPGDDFVTGNALPAIYAVYPYDEGTTISNDCVLSMNLPAIQRYAGYGFGPGANTMVSATEENDLLFKNLGGYLMVKLYGEGVSVSKVSLKGNGGERLAGKGIVTASLDGVPTVEMTGEATDEITVECTSPVSLGATAENATEFWFVLPPTTFSEGFTITVTDPGGKKYEKTTSKTITIDRNHLSRMSAIEVEYPFWDDNTVPPDNEIWYVTTDGKAIESPMASCFDAQLLSNQYNDGKGILRFNQSVSSIQNAFMYQNTIRGIRFPEGLVTIGPYSCFECEGLKYINIPESCRIIDEWAFERCEKLESITLPDGLVTIGDHAFQGCSSVKQVTIPNSVENIGSASFCYCYNLSAFYGKYATNDHLALVVTSDSDSKLIQFALGSDLEEYTVPEGITSTDGFARCRLKRVTLPETLTVIDKWGFEGCELLEEIHFPSSLKKIEYAAFGWNTSLRHLELPGSIEFIGENAFVGLTSLQSIVLGNGIIDIPATVFQDCWNLKEVVIPESCLAIGIQAFKRSFDYETLSIYCRSLTPPCLGRDALSADISAIYVPMQSVEAYKSNTKWSSFADIIIGYDYQDLQSVDYGFYVSSDYSIDEEVECLQTASEGLGINLVLMGDAFSDRQITEGEYKQAMQSVMEAFFSEEPFKSYQKFFNVYSVNVVSKTEGYDHSGQTLSTHWAVVGNAVGGDDLTVIEYGKKAVAEDHLDDSVIIVLMNAYSGGGTCYMYDAPGGNYGRGLSIAYFPKSSDTESLNGIVLHEAGGHGFAKLADEYAYSNYGSIPQVNIEEALEKSKWGWWKNIDFTGDPAEVKWAQFIADPRYAAENIGCYEGAYTYWTGVWRPTENSIMRYNAGGFNAPSRYAIWYRMGKLAYGESWNGTYEDFVAYDAVNRTPAAVQKRQMQNQRRLIQAPLPPLAPPVVVGHSWRQAQ